MRKRCGNRLPSFTEEEKELIKGTSEFFGLYLGPFFCVVCKKSDPQFLDMTLLVNEWFFFQAKIQTCWFLKYNTVFYIPFYSELFFFYYVVVYCFVFYYLTFATLYDAVLYFGNVGISRWPQESLFHSICCSPKGRIRFKYFDLAPLGFWFDTWAFLILGHFILLEQS